MTTTWEDSELDILQSRIQLLEDVVNDIQVSISNLANLDQVRQLMLLKEKIYTEQGEKIAILEAQLNILKAKVYE